MNVCATFTDVLQIKEFYCYINVYTCFSEGAGQV